MAVFVNLPRVFMAGLLSLLIGVVGPPP